MNNLINKFLLAGNKFMTETQLRWPGFTHSACGPFTKNKEKIQKFKACFQHDIAMEILKIYLEEQLLMKYYVIKQLILLRIQNMMNTSIFYKYFEKISATHTYKSFVNTFGGAIKSEIMSTQQ